MASPELRQSERIPLDRPVKVIRNGRIFASVPAANLSQGGIRLNALMPIQIGSPCEIAIPRDGDEAEDLKTEGIVIRNDDQGTVLQFVSTLAKASVESVVYSALAGSPHSLLESYRNYFRVSRSKNLEHCESLLGVTKAQFRAVFYSTFSASMVLAILPVWILRASIPPYPNGVKILLAFVYGAIWMLFLQPTMDLVVFRLLKKARTPRGRHGGGSGLHRPPTLLHR